MGKTSLLATIFFTKLEKTKLEQFSVYKIRCILKSMPVPQCHVKLPQNMKNGQFKKI